MMTDDDVAALRHGVYRIHWRSGGFSVAAVGHTASGEKWFAPANWISVPWYIWTEVDRVELIEEQQYNNLPEEDDETDELSRLREALQQAAALSGSQEVKAFVDTVLRGS